MKQESDFVSFRYQTSLSPPATCPSVRWFTLLRVPSRKKEETVIVIVSPGCESQALVGVGIASHSSSSTTPSEVSALLANDASLIVVLL